MNSPPHGRRASDRASEDPATPERTPTASALVAVVREWRLLILAAAAFVGAMQGNLPGVSTERLDRIERQQAASRVIDSIGITDRVALAEALTVVARVQCRADAQRAIDNGIPCARLTAGERWQLLGAPVRPAALPAPSRTPIDGVAALAPLLVVAP